VRSKRWRAPSTPTASEKTDPSKERGENKNVDSSGRTRRRHQAQNTLLARFRGAKSISGSKVECLWSHRVYYLSGKLHRVGGELGMLRRRCLSRSYNVTKEVSMPYPKSQIQIRWSSPQDTTFVQSKPTENMRPICPPPRSVTRRPDFRSHTLTP